MATSGNGNKDQNEDQTLGPVVPKRILLAQGSNVWKVYVFLRRNGAFGNGHTAVGFQDPEGFSCGGIENYNQSLRASQIGAGDQNDGWFLTGINQERMFDIMNRGAGQFSAAYVRRLMMYWEGKLPKPEGKIPAARDQRDYNPTTTHKVVDQVEVGPYGETAEFLYKEPVYSPNFNAARKLLENLPNRGYTIFGNNCNNAVAEILRAYGIPRYYVPENEVEWKPVEWYDALNKDVWHKTKA